VLVPYLSVSCSSSLLFQPLLEEGIVYFFFVLGLGVESSFIRERITGFKFIYRWVVRVIANTF
jgi:hypothetical protein